MVVFDKFCYNFIVRVLVFSTSFLLREGWESSRFLECEMGSVTNTFTEHIMFEGQVVIDKQLC
jgi:hypothetical protein